MANVMDLFYILTYITYSNVLFILTYIKAELIIFSIITYRICMQLTTNLSPAVPQFIFINEMTTTEENEEIM